MDIKKRIAALRKRHGSYRKAGEATDIGYAYLCKLANGTKENPTTATLRKLGLVR